MYEMIKINENDYYIECPAKMGIVKISNDEVIMIDSGNDKDAGKKALKHIEENGWKLKAIYNTHSHADHIGGNKLLQTRTGCKVYAYGVEKDFTNHTLLEPAFLYGGFPPEELLSKFTYAQESDAEELTEEVLPEGFKLIILHGHSVGMVGFLTPNGTAYIGDALLSEETLTKYAVSYIYDIDGYMKTLEYLKGFKAEYYVPAHAPAMKDISALIDFNIQSSREVGDKILELTKDPCNFDILLKRIFTAYGIPMNIAQYCLIGTTVKSYLLWMRKEGKVENAVVDNEILWRAK